MFLMVFAAWGLVHVIKLVNHGWFELLQNSPTFMILAALAAVGILVVVMKIKLRCR
jgi:uncharacterized membrane protein YadS